MALLTPRSTPHGPENDDDFDDTAKQDESNLESRQNGTVSTWSRIARRDFYDASSSGSVIVKFKSPVAYRLQLRSVAVDNWFPQDPDLGLDQAFACAASLAPICPALAVAFDSSSLVNLGQLNGDTRMLQAGQKLYINSLRLMRIALKTLPNDDLQLQALAAAIQVIQCTEAFTSMSSKDTDWRSHCRGLTAILESRASSDCSAGFLEFLDANFRTFYFWDALIAKRAIKVFFPSDAPVLLQIAQRVPGLLAKVDAFCRDQVDRSIDRATAVLDMLSQAEAQLNSWMACWNPSMRRAPFELVSSTTVPFPDFQTKKPSRAFPLVFKFRALSDAVDHAICSACLLSVKRAMLDVQLTVYSATHSVNSTHGIATSASALTKAVTKCADTLCMGLPFLCDSEHNFYGYVTASGPLFVADSWYKHLRRLGDEKASEKVLWCFEAAKRLKVGGIGPLEEPGKIRKHGRTAKTQSGFVVEVN